MGTGLVSCLLVEGLGKAWTRGFLGWVFRARVVVSWNKLVWPE